MIITIKSKHYKKTGTNSIDYQLNAICIKKLSKRPSLNYTVLNVYKMPDLNISIDR